MHGNLTRNDDPADKSITYGYKVPVSDQTYPEFTQLVADHNDWRMMDGGRVDVANYVVAEPGDWLVLCSDGLYTVLPDGMITTLFTVTAPM